MSIVELSVLFVAGVLNYYYWAGQMRTELSFAVFIMIYFALGFCGKRISHRAEGNGSDIQRGMQGEVESFVRYSEYE